jgi:chorismate synthase
VTGNILGERFVVVSFGESHGRCVGVVVDGCPAGLPLKVEEIQREVDLRRPGATSISTPRAEQDRVEVLSGLFEGYTTGAPIAMLIWNRDVDSTPYQRLVNRPRPGHADYVARMKYGGFNDYRGGGRFSGRMTAGYVMAGAIAKKLLAHTLGAEIVAYTLEIGGVRAKPVDLETAKRERYLNDARAPDPEAARAMSQVVEAAAREGDSVGGIIECVATNIPLGLGEPVFSPLNGDLARALFIIPAVKGVEVGSGFQAARMKGSEHNDPYVVREGRITTLTNRAGGIVGGISTGMPIVVRVAFKPPSSIRKPQQTVDLETMEEVELVVEGRHDPCIVPRAVPVVEAMTALVLADHALRAGFIPPVLGKRR